MPFKIVRNDITKMKVDVIVNTANEAPIYSAGTDMAVYKAAGENELIAERRKIGYLKGGEVAITPGFKLPAKYIIHAVSPYYKNGKSGEEEKLRSCYKKSLELAAEHGCKSIAFPLIATGSYGYPKEEGMLVALDEINSFLLRHEMLIYLVVFDTRSTKLGLMVYPDLEAYIDHNYVCDKREEEYGDRYFGSIREGDAKFDLYRQERAELEERLCRPIMCDSVMEIAAPKKSSPKASVKRASKKAFKELTTEEYYDLVEENGSAIDERMKHLSDTFQEYLMFLISSKGYSNTEVYKGAYLTKQLFSKIKLNPEYQPDKATVMRLCIGAKLNLDETKDLLARAGFALSPCDKRDVVFSYFIEKEYYDLVELDVELEERGLKCFLAS